MYSVVVVASSQSIYWWHLYNGGNFLGPFIAHRKLKPYEVDSAENNYDASLMHGDYHNRLWRLLS